MGVGHVTIIIPAYITSEKGKEDLISLENKIQSMIKAYELELLWNVVVVDDGSPEAIPDSLMKRYWRGEIPRRRGGECYKPEDSGDDIARAARRTCEEDS